MKKQKLFLVVFFIIWCTGFFGGFVGVLGYQLLRPKEYRAERYNYSHSYSDRADIVKVNYDGELQTNGDLFVKETLRFDISSETAFRELYREFDLIKESGTDAYQDSGSFSVAEIIDGVEVPLKKISAPTVGDNRVKGTFAVATTSTHKFDELRWYIDIKKGSPTYVVTYTYKNVLDVYSDTAILDLLLWTGGSVEYIKEYSASVTFPDGVIDGDFKCFAHNQKSSETTLDGNKLSLHIKNPKGAVNLDMGFIELRAVTGANALPIFNSAVNQIAEPMYAKTIKQEADWAAGQKSFETKQIVDTIIDIVFALAVAVGAVVLVKALRPRIGRRYRPAVDYKYFRDLPESGFLLTAELAAARRTVKKNVMAGAVMNLCANEYIEFYKIDTEKQWSSRNIGIKLTPKGASELEAAAVPKKTRAKAVTETDESLEVAALKKTRTRIKPAAVAGLSGYDALVFNYFVQLGLTAKHPIWLAVLTKSSSLGFAQLFYKSQESEIERVRKESGFFETVKGKGKNLHTILHGVTMAAGLLSAIAVCLLSIAFSTTFYGFAVFTPIALLWTGVIVGIGGLYGSRDNILTQKGEDAAAECTGLYNFFNDMTRVKEADLPDVRRLEEYLVYATALGVGKKVIKALRLRYPKDFSSGTYFNRYGGDGFAASYIGRAVGHRTSTAQSFGSPTSFSGGGFSSGGGGGFSSGGGGGHGGGGGGGRH
ncbi:MAG: DUF2207 domain-containing protein [Clostridiales bacterium]|jgi:hypothetical protein|nr:DUF2207 domain-containing protein [Clostridiales bacterium]